MTETLNVLFIVTDYYAPGDYPDYYYDDPCIMAIIPPATTTTNSSTTTTNTTTTTTATTPKSCDDYPCPQANHHCTDLGESPRCVCNDGYHDDAEAWDDYLQWGTEPL